jgi:dual specificity protein kinase YAK1
VHKPGFAPCVPTLPQVVLGHQYTMAIDMWSLGCVAAELFLGLPLFPGASEHDLLSRVVEMMGAPPAYMLAAAKNTDKYFRRFETVVQGPMGASATSVLLLPAHNRHASRARPC